MLFLLCLRCALHKTPPKLHPDGQHNSLCDGTQYWLSDLESWNLKQSEKCHNQTLMLKWWIRNFLVSIGIYYLQQRRTLSIFIFFKGSHIINFPLVLMDWLAFCLDFIWEIGSHGNHRHPIIPQAHSMSVVAQNILC